MNQNPEIEKLNKKAKEYSKMLQGIHAEMSKVIVGQDAVIENLILALATQGHVLLKGVPGLAKTLLIKTLADCIDLDFVRLQFTPDLLPADIIGTKIYDHNTTSFKTVRGPIFSNFVLVDDVLQRFNIYHKLNINYTCCLSIWQIVCSLHLYWVLCCHDMTKNGRSILCVSPCMLTCCSCIASSNAD